MFCSPQSSPCPTSCHRGSDEVCPEEQDGLQNSLQNGLEDVRLEELCACELVRSRNYCLRRHQPKPHWQITSHAGCSVDPCTGPRRKRDVLRITDDRSNGRRSTRWNTSKSLSAPVSLAASFVTLLSLSDIVAAAPAHLQKRDGSTVRIIVCVTQISL